jgi:hypothetical protein
MTIDARLPGAAGMSKTSTFGTTSVRLFAPQHLFELVHAQVTATLRGPGAGSSGSIPEAANENHQPQQNSAA